MRVLFLTHRLPYAPNRGDRIRARYILGMLADFADVHLVSLVHDREEEAHAQDLRALAHVTTVRVPRFRNLLNAGRALTRSTPLTHALLDAPGLADAISRASARSPDVVLAYCSGMARLALHPLLAQVPLVLDLVDVDSEKWKALSGTAAAPQRWIYAAEARRLAQFEMMIAKRAKFTLVVNNREAFALRRLTADANVRVVENGVDVSALRPTGPPASEPRVVFCGVMDYGPNEDAAVRLGRFVWPLVRARHPEAGLALVGARPPRSVRALSRRDSTIEVTGTVADVRPHLWRSAIAVAPLSTARGVQNKVLEAVAAGLPSVVTKVVFDGLPDAVRPACVVEDSDEGLARTIVNLLRLPARERRRIADSADMARLDWTSQLRPLRGVLEEATGMCGAFPGRNINEIPIP